MAVVDHGDVLAVSLLAGDEAAELLAQLPVTRVLQHVPSKRMDQISRLGSMPDNEYLVERMSGKLSRYLILFPDRIPFIRPNTWRSEEIQLPLSDIIQICSELDLD